MIWFWIDVPWACGGIATDAAGMVIECAPIFRRTAMGRQLNDVIRAYRRRGPLRWVRLPDA